MPLLRVAIDSTRAGTIRIEYALDVFTNNSTDDDVISRVSQSLIQSAGGLDKLKTQVGELLRESIDSVIKTPKTGRRIYDELESSEKTYIGTCVEIDLRDRLGLEKGVILDLLISGTEVDVKFSAKRAWMIPPEAINHPCVLISANEAAAACSFGVFIARFEYLNAPNRDQKRGIKSTAPIRWLFRDERYPINFWQSVDPAVAEKIAARPSGNKRVVALFRELPGRPIKRKVVEDVASQKDFMRRMRADAGSGARDELARENIAILWGGNKDARELIRRLELPPIARDEFMSIRLTGEAEIKIAQNLGCLRVTGPR